MIKGSGFTLLEMLVVLVILGMTTAMVTQGLTATWQTLASSRIRLREHLRGPPLRFQWLFRLQPRRFCRFRRFRRFHRFRRFVLCQPRSKRSGFVGPRGRCWVPPPLYQSVENVLSPMSIASSTKNLPCDVGNPTHRLWDCF